MNSKFKVPQGNSRPSARLYSGIINMVFLVFSLIWFIAVVKVILLESEGRSTGENVVKTDSSLSSSATNIKKTFSNYDANIHTLPKPDISKALEGLPHSLEWKYVKDPVKVARPEGNGIGQIPVMLNPAPGKPIVKNNNNIKTSPKIKTNDESKKKRQFNNVANANDKPQTNLIPAYELNWPPVQIDGKISETDGYEVMTITNLKVPRFWEPRPTEDLMKSGTKINNQETIFLMIASYRDFQCHETINSAFRTADHPERLFVGAVDQSVPGDTGCAFTEKPCSEDPNQIICKYRNQISVYNMDASLATGPVTARHIGDRLYRGQYFVMQMDAHCQFIRHWDTLLITQFQQTHNEMAVLSSYLSDVQGSLDANANSLRDTRPIMCNSDFEGEMPSRYLRHGSQPEDYAIIREGPQLQPFWAAGFSFSRGHFKVQVPYDALQPMVFQGEEISIGIRGFTYGYDFYAPRDSVVFHEYAEKSDRRKKVPMFWENSQKHRGEAKKSLARSMSIIRMSPDIDPSAWDHREEKKYGIGTERSVDLFYKLFLIDTVKRKATQLCPFVKSGIMHRTFSKFLRPNGLGIDYKNIENFDTAAALKKRLKELKESPQEE